MALLHLLSPTETRSAVLFGGLAAGFLDIIFAIVRNGTLGIPARAVLQSITSGIWGSAAYQGGRLSALTGLLLHFTMTIAMAAIYVVIIQRVGLARQTWLASGLLFGLTAYLVMNFVVVPLSRFPAGSLPFSYWALAAHIFLVGLPIAFAARCVAPAGQF